MNCRHCQTTLQHVFLDLGFAPASNAYLSKEELQIPELYFPLKLYVCDSCWLVQTEDYSRSEELFTENYAYFSSISTSWLAHARKYYEMITERLKLNSKSFVVEIACNDGYLLKHFVKGDIPSLGVEPTDSTAQAAENLGITVKREFFSQTFVEQKFGDKKADLIIGNNVYAHVPDINDFTRAMKSALKPCGTITLEFPHLLNLIQQNQFDTVYHEHYSYLSLNAVQQIFEKAGLKIYDVEELPTHGGSLRVYGCHLKSSRNTSGKVANILDVEKRKGLQKIETYQEFQSKAEKIKNDLLDFLIKQNRVGKRVVAYGAAAKGNTLLNYSGIKSDLLAFVCDAASSKQGRFMPGSHIQILSPEAIFEDKPDFVLILPWNITKEVININKSVYEWGGKFVRAVPSLEII